MRTPICDINMFPPTPKISTLVRQNTNLKASNNALTYVLLGITVAGIIGLVIYVRNEHKKEEEARRKVN